MHLSSIAFILHITCICAIGTAQTNITFKSSPIILEAGLFGHLTTIYNDSTLYIFGGNTESGSVLPYVPSQSVYTLQLTSPDTVYHYQIPTLPDWTYVEDGAPMDFLGDPDTTFMNPTAISCAFPHTNCHTRIDDTIYAFIPNDNNDNLFVYKYNVITKSFPSGTAWDNTNYANQITHMLAYENEYENVKYYVDGCIVSDGAEYIYSFGTIQSSASTYHGFKYNALLDMFILLEFDGLFNRGYAVGCNIDIHNANIYVFGGTFYNGFEMDIIEKWNINDDTWSVVDDGMEHKRSHLTVHVLTSAHETYFIIMGGTTQEAKQSIEIFDANIDEMVLTLSITTDLIHRYAFSTFLWNDLLYIHGGAVFNDVNRTLSIKSDCLCANITDAIHRFYGDHTYVPSSTPTDAPTMTQSPSGAPTSQSVSPTWTPTLEPTLASFDPTDECFERGMCALGYMDQTNGNTEYLSCGSQCIGGAYLTDLDCNCACVLVGLCPQLCYSDEYCYSYDIYPSNASTVTFDPVYIQHVHDNRNTTFNVYVKPHTLPCIQPSITFEYELIVEYLIITNEDASWSTTCSEFNIGCDMWSTCLQSVPIGTAQIDVDTVYAITIQDTADWAMCAHGYDINARLTLTCQGTVPPSKSPTSPTQSPTIFPTSLTQSPTNFPTFSPTLITNNPTHFPTIPPTSPTAEPTPEPTRYGASLCSTSPYTWCYYIDLYPGNPQRTTTVSIQHKKMEYALHPSGTYFNLYFTMRNGTCLTPLIDFEYEPIDMDSDDEYILITGTTPTNMTHMFGKCSYANNMCGQMITCIDQMFVSMKPPNRFWPFSENEKYLVQLYLPGNVDPLCDEYIINARLHWTCHNRKNADRATSSPSLPSARPTIMPTVEPTQATSQPTIHPSHPTNSPIPTVPPSQTSSSAPSQPTSNDDGIVFYPLSIQLPQSISNHISVVYEDRLHIIGGLLSYKSIETMTNIYNNDNHNLTTIHDFDFEIYTNILPSWKHTGPSSIACSHQCYVTINDTVFIQVLNDDVSDLFYVKYSLSEATFEPNDYDDYTDSYVDTLESIGTVESDEMPQNLMYQCVVYDEKRFIYSFGSNLMSDLLPQALRYDTWDNRWSRLNITNDDSIIFLWYPTQASSCVYCTIDSAFVYTFGGRYKGRDFGTYIEVPFIYKYNIVTQTRSVLDATLTYERSFSTAAPIKLDPNETPQYVVIYGGTTAISKSYIEIFDVVNEIMIYYDVNSNDNVVNSINFNLLNANLMNYSSFLYNDTLCINGGVSSEYDFQILNLSDIFDVDAFYPFTQDPVDYSCIHTHVMNGGFSIPEYIYRNTNQMMMNTIPLDDQEKNYRIMFQSSPSTFSLAKLGKQCPDTYGSEYDCIAISTTVWALYSGNIPWGDWTLDISPIQWNIANKDDITLYWMSWTDSTIFKVGIGDVYNDERLTFAASDQVNYPLINDIDWIAIYPIQDSGDIKFIFYSNECELSVDLLLMNDSFSVGDRLLIEWNLTRANALYSNVWIHSDDMKLNYTMRINENEFNESECILSSPYSSLNDSLCEEGIQISELTTYDVNQNAYQIVVSTLHPILTSNDDSGVKITQNVFAFQRSIMHINLSMNTDDTISPQRPLGFSIQYDESSPTQQHAHITVIFDDRLQISDDNTAQMTIDFYTDSCQITYAKKGIYKTQACLDEFVIPSDMFIANIGNDNAYSITMQSVDSVLSKQDFIVSRNVQTVSMEIMNKNRSVSLGDKIEIEFAVIDYDIYQPASIIYVTSAELGINAITRIAYTNDTNMTCEIEDLAVIDDKHTCSHCICDVSLHNLKASSINSTLNMQFNSFETYLTQYDVPIYVDNCPIGYGLQSGSANDIIPCTQCALNTINIHRNSECIGCNKIDGIECIGQSKMQITFNYWTHFDAQQNAIISSYCPVGRCCRSKDGCLRDISSSSSSSTLLCAKHRDESIPLCGGCIAGYSEVFGTANCSQCRRNHYELLLFPFFIAMVYVLFLAHCNTKTETNFDTSQSELSYANLFAKDDMEAIKIALLRPMVYLFEAISIITIQTGYAFYLQPLLDVFSMQFIIAEYGGANRGLCLTKHLTAIGKLLWCLFFPFSMLIILFIYYIVYEKLTVFKFKRFKPNFLNAFWYTILIMLGTFLDKMFKILACRRLDSDAIGTVHFYAGNVMCYGLEWTLSLCTLILLIVFWIVMWYKLYMMDPLKRNSTKSVTRNLSRSYKPRFWYWEFILITRRISLAFIITFNYLSESFTQYILLSILIFYLTIHVRYSPFKHGRVNYFETFCIVLLILGLTCLGFDLQQISPLFVAIVLSLVVLIPFILFIYFIVILIKTYHNQTHKDNSNAAGNIDWDEMRLSTLRGRMTGSQQDVFAHMDIGLPSTAASTLRSRASISKDVNDNKNDNNIQLTETNTGETTCKPVKSTAVKVMGTGDTSSSESKKSNESTIDIVYSDDEMEIDDADLKWVDKAFEDGDDDDDDEQP